MAVKLPLSKAQNLSKKRRYTKGYHTNFKPLGRLAQKTFAAECQGTIEKEYPAISDTKKGETLQIPKIENFSASRGQHEISLDTQTADQFEQIVFGRNSMVAALLSH